MKELLGKKLGMTQIFVNNRVIPVTAIEAGPCVIVRKKTKDSDGYEALQIGFEEIKEKKLNKPELKYFEKMKAKPVKYLKEVRVDNSGTYEVGQSLKVDMFELTEFVDVEGVSKGKGFQGIVKRYGARGGPASHGSMFYRAPGSIGASSDPSRVFKNAKMPGKMGHKRRTAKNLEVVLIDAEKNILFVKGAVPGPISSLVVVKKTGKKKIIHVKAVKKSAAKKTEKKKA